MKSCSVVLLVGFVLFGSIAQRSAEDGGSECLRDDYYADTCPQAESIIATIMQELVCQDVNVSAHMLRLSFHDCFIRGCDASILLNSTSESKAERDAPPNNPSLKGFDIIDQIKAALEQACPGVVSCADIIVYAARESVFLVGLPYRYNVKGGRKDGRVSLYDEALRDLPSQASNVSTLIEKFAEKGLSAEEMVTLSGAHSIGVSHCSSLLKRQFNLSNGLPDPLLDPEYAAVLRGTCPKGITVDNIVFMDTFTPTVLDNKYYVGVLQDKGLLTSDATLLTNDTTKKQVMAYADDPTAWEEKFVAAMIKMGEIEVKVGTQGEVRRTCSFIN